MDQPYNICEHFDGTHLPWVFRDLHDFETSSNTRFTFLPTIHKNDRNSVILGWNLSFPDLSSDRKLVQLLDGNNIWLTEIIITPYKDISVYYRVFCYGMPYVST